MAQSIPDAERVAAVLLPVDEARIYLSACHEALTGLRARLLEAEHALGEGLRACNRAREALLRHQERP